MFSFHKFYEEVRTAHTIKVGLDILRPDKSIKKEAKDGEYRESDNLATDEPFVNSKSFADQIKPEINLSVDQDFEQSEHTNDDHSSTSSEPEPEPTKRGRGRPRKNQPVVFDKRSAKCRSVDSTGKYFSMNCNKCEATLCDLSDAMFHYKSQHKTFGYLMCCGRKFDRQKAIDDHCRIHEDPTEHK